MPTWRQDFVELLRILNDESVRFLVIGGVAYNFYAPPRATKDIDLWVEPTRGNLEALQRAVARFGFPVDFDVDALLDESVVLMLGRAPYRVDLLTRPRGVSWPSAWASRRRVRYDDVEIGILSPADLIASKRAAGRSQDIADVETLELIATLEREEDLPDDA
jgi:predicted nucleotidyltransferase